MEVEPVKKKSKGHRCYICGQRFPTIHIVRRHVSVHKEKNYECPFCNNFFSSNWSLSNHIKIHTGERPYNCPYCKRAFRQKGNLTNHIASIHENNETNSYCLACGKRMKPLSSSQGSYCWFCCYKMDLLTKNIEPTSTSVISESIDECTVEIQDAGKTDDVSDKSKNISYSLADIKNVSANESDDDDLIYASKDALMENCDNSQKPVCSQCMCEFPNFITLRDHVSQVHRPHYLFSCDLCSLKFATAEALNNHTFTHKEKRPYSCLICSRSFKNQLGLKNHLLTHRADRPFKCNKCDLSFKTKTVLKAHFMVHQRERPFKCLKCGFSFKTIFLLKKHTIVHTGEKPYKCDQCGKLFRYPGNLGRHYNLHMQHQTYMCSVCGKNFPQSAGLKQHEKTVHNKNLEAEKTFMCPICQKGYKLESQFRRHLTLHRKTT